MVRLTQWSTDAIQDSGPFRVCFMAYTAEMGSPWQFQVKTSGHQKIVFSLTPFLEEKETSPIRPSLQSNWATLLIWTLDIAGRIRCRCSALSVGPAPHVPCVPGQVREPNQDIIRKEEVGNSARLGTNSGPSSVQGASGACARAHFSLVVSLTHTISTLLYQLVTLITLSSSRIFSCASDTF